MLGVCRRDELWCACSIRPAAPRAPARHQATRDRGPGYVRRHSSPVTLLMPLATEAGLSRLGADGHIQAIGDQFRVLRDAAHAVAIDHDVPLSGLPALTPQPSPSCWTGRASRYLHSSDCG